MTNSNEKRSESIEEINKNFKVDCFTQFLGNFDFRRSSKLHCVSLLDVYKQHPKATLVLPKEKWESYGYEVPKEAMPIVILNNNAIGYDFLYDISDTINVHATKSFENYAYEKEYDELLKKAVFGTQDRPSDYIESKTLKKLIDEYIDEKVDNFYPIDKNESDEKIGIEGTFRSFVGDIALLAVMKHMKRKDIFIEKHFKCVYNYLMCSGEGVMPIFGAFAANIIETLIPELDKQLEMIYKKNKDKQQDETLENSKEKTMKM